MYAAAADLLAVIEPETGGREIIDPATGRTVGRAPEHTAADLQAAIAAAKTAQPDWAGLGHKERSVLLHRAADAVEANAEALAELHHRPLGVVGAIGPWNWPMMIGTWQLAPALRMGNTVVIKPSGNTPLSVLALAHVLNSVLPADVLHVVSGRRDVGAVLAGHPESPRSCSPAPPPPARTSSAPRPGP